MPHFKQFFFDFLNVVFDEFLQLICMIFDEILQLLYILVVFTVWHGKRLSLKFY